MTFALTQSALDAFSGADVSCAPWVTAVPAVLVLLVLVLVYASG